jgi:hypothetical protein
MRSLTTTRVPPFLLLRCVLILFITRKFVWLLRDVICFVPREHDLPTLVRLTINLIRKRATTKLIQCSLQRL